MKFKGALGMTLALATIGSYYFLVDIPAEKKKKESKERSEKIVLFEEKNVTNLTLYSTDSKISLKKDGGHWKVVDPVKAKSDEDEVDNLLNTLKNAKHSRVVDEAPTDLSSFGLKDPKLTLTLGLKEKNNTSILLGEDSPIGSSLYIKLSDKPAVLLSSVARKDLTKSLYDLRDKTILGFSKGSITKINVERENIKMGFEKKENNWIVKSGELNSKGESSEVINLLSSIDVGKIKSFEEEDPKDLALFGLDKPEIKITLSEKDDAKSHVLLIGSIKGDTHYAKTEGSKNVFALETALVAKFPKDPLDFLSKKLFDFAKENVTGFETKTQNETIKAVNKGEKDTEWKLEEPIETATDTATINSLLFDLSGAQVMEYVIGKAENLETYGLDSPQKSFAMNLKDKNKQALFVGKETLTTGTFFAMRSGESSIFTVKKDSLDKIFRTLHELRNKSLVSLKMEDATKIELKYPEKTFELVVSGDDWSLTKPEKNGDIKSFKARDVLWTLNNLEFVEVIEATLTEETTGLNKPKLEVTVWDKDKKQLAHVKVGEKTEDALYYAQTEGKPSIYKIKERFLDEIPSKLDDFKPTPPPTED
jgi:hypothetical protein